MSVNFMGLARELRDEIYTNLLVCEDDIDLTQPWSFPNLPVQVLRVNRTIHEEAAEILYGHNRFDLSRSSHGYSPFGDTRLDSFLERIGPISALHIRRIRIDFPRVSMHVNKSGDVLAVDSEVDAMFNTLQEHCGNLQKVTLSQGSAEFRAKYLNEHQRPGFLLEVLNLVESRIRAITARQDAQQPVQDKDIVIAVEVNAATVEEEASTEMRREMVSRGWVLDQVEVVEEDYDDEMAWQDDRDMSPDMDWDREDSDDGASDYDIANDSDFWRRAGD